MVNGGELSEELKHMRRMQLKLEAMEEKMVKMHEATNSALWSIKQKQEDHVKTMIALSPRLDHQHVVRCEPGADHTARTIFQVMELCNWEMFAVLRKEGRLSAEVTAHCSAQVAAGLAHMHRMQVVHRNVKPETVLLGADGLLKLSSFIFVKHVTEKTFTLCGTPEYLAPEVLMTKGHSLPADVWCLGILTFEMLHGLPPFYADDPMDIYQKILEGKLKFASYIDDDARFFVRLLLDADQTRRPHVSSLLRPGSWLPAEAVGKPSLLQALAAKLGERELGPYADAHANGAVVDEAKDPFRDDPLFTFSTDQDALNEI